MNFIFGPLQLPSALAGLRGKGKKVQQALSLGCRVGWRFNYVSIAAVSGQETACSLANVA
ncbi:MAG: hypothetical protein HZT43_05505 [Exiguobacterium profundum]|nr:MAG: hypothetical protein HZT43_05505 [Exiguobacterium profundum]